MSSHRIVFKKGGGVPGAPEGTKGPEEKNVAATTKMEEKAEPVKEVAKEIVEKVNEAAKEIVEELAKGVEKEIVAEKKEIAANAATIVDSTYIDKIPEGKVGETKQATDGGIVVGPPSGTGTVPVSGTVPVPVSDTVPVPVSSLPDANPYPLFEHLPDRYKEMKFDYKFVFNGPQHEKYAHTLKNQKLDVEKYQRRLKGSLPDSSSLEKYIPFLLSQGSIGACVSHSAATALYILMNQSHTSKWALSRMLSSARPFISSRLFIYDNARRIDGTPLYQDVGTTNISGCMGIKKYGVCEESLWPYEKENVFRLPDSECYIEGAKYKNFKYSVLEQTVEDVKYAISSGHAVMCGVLCYPSFIHAGERGRDGDVPLPHKSEQVLGGHSILLVSFDDNSRRFGFCNWWSSPNGPKWGRGLGFGTIGYQYLENSEICGDLIAVEEFS